VPACPSSPIDLLAARAGAPSDRVTDPDASREVDAQATTDLVAELAKVPDPRSRRGVRHRLVTVLALAVCAVLAGARGEPGRREVREMMQAGRTDAEIRQFMIDRYGDFVLYRPRMNATNFLLWAAPALLLLIGSGVAVRFIRRRTAEVDEDDAESGAGRA